MEVPVTRPSRLFGRGRKAAAVIFMTVLLALPAGIVLASHQFSDVPDSNIFHADIDAVADAGVTTGCAAGKYCPNDNVTRGQMAAFMNRLGALQAGKTPVVNARTSQSTDGMSLGCPANTIWSQGICIDTALREAGANADGIYDASDSCATIGTALPLFGGYRWFLPTANQLLSAARVSGLNVLTAEWASDMWYDSTDGWSGLIVLDFFGSKITAPASGADDYPYRCATYPISSDGLIIILPEGKVNPNPDSAGSTEAQLDYKGN